MNSQILVGDNLASLRKLAADGVLVDSVVTDPPYGLTSEKRSYRRASPVASQRAKAAGFMGCEWDAAVPSVEFWRLVCAVLKPGGHVLSFGGTRTYHRMACAIEDAGFEIRDQIMWIYGSGFPKSKNIGGGFGTALKPACEPIALARKPLGGKTVAANVLEFRTGALNVDGCRIEGAPIVYKNGCGGGKNEVNRMMGSNQHNDAAFRSRAWENTAGRWPANVLLDADAAAVMGEPARFFYCAKASARERAGSTHPTVKPVALMRYLCRLITPPGGTVLDPFAGSGTTGEAALLEGFSVILMEREHDYTGDIETRLARARIAA